MTQRLLIINGSLRGREGNTARLLQAATRYVPPEVLVDELELASYEGTVEAMAERLVLADVLLFGTGVYWGSWGSPLQRFLEVMTGYEASGCFFGKPAGVAVTMDSVGGGDIAQRLVGVLTTLGCMVPPLGLVVVSRVGALVRDLPGNEDVWQSEDLGVVMHNLFVAAEHRTTAWASWPTIRVQTGQGTYPASGALPHGLAHFEPDGGTVAGPPGLLGPLDLPRAIPS